jgi:cardiolipin synthase A/B
MHAPPTYLPIETQCDGHRLRFIVGGQERLQSLISVIDGAHTSLALYFYIFAADASANRVSDALIEARNRGVLVTLLVDGFGTNDQPDEVFRPMIEAGVQFSRFLPGFSPRYLLRNHQKMLIADDHIAIIGGSNIEDSYFTDDPGGDSWHDLFVQIEGEAAARLGAYHAALCRWMLSEKPTIRGLNRLLQRHSEAEGGLRWVYSGPFKRFNPLRKALATDLAKATQVDMIQAYFAPNLKYLNRLDGVAKRGRFRMITAARSDSNTTISAARHCYAGLLRNQAEIYEYLPQKLHMKLIVVDDVTYVGSANFDMRSLYLNAEIMLRIEDAKVADAMRAFIDSNQVHSGHVSQISHRRNASLFSRARWLLGYLIVSVVDYGVTRTFAG